MICPYCGSDDLQERGTNESKTRKRTFCKNCKHYPSFPLSEENLRGTSDELKSYFKEENNHGEIGFQTHNRITTLEQLIEYCNIDTVYWEIERWVCNKWEVGAKDVNKNLVIEPLFQVKVWLRKRVEEIRSSNNVQTLIDDAKSFAPKYQKINYQKHDRGLLYEVQIPDVHFGR